MGMMRNLFQAYLIVASCLVFGGAGLCADEIYASRAELIALKTSELILPPRETVQAIAADLSEIETAYPELAGHDVRPPWQPGSLLVGLTAPANEIYKDGGSVREIDSLNATLGGQVKRHYPELSLLLLEFDRPLNPVALKEQYDALESVMAAVPNGTGGEGDDITLLRDQGIYIYLKAWGDCRAGCIYKEYRYFRVTDAVEELSAPDVAEEIGFYITIQPDDVHVSEGGITTFSFRIAGGDELLKYSWIFWQRLDRQALEWATISSMPTLTLTDIKNAQEGVYSARIRHVPTGLWLQTHGALLQVDDLDPLLWRRAYPMENGWAAAWIGYFYKAQLPWIYVAGVDWFYPVGSDEDAWLWNDVRGWQWTSIDFHPWVYNATNGEWTHGL